MDDSSAAQRHIVEAMVETEAPDSECFVACLDFTLLLTRWFAFVCVCVYVCMYVCMYVYVCVCVCVCVM